MGGFDLSLQIRRVRLLVSTAKGDYGTDLKFDNGLILLHKDNTRGKSTALKSIIYALGLERMFGPVDQPPLTPAMTTELKDEQDRWPVIESWVFVEIGNSAGRIATLRRKVAGSGGQDHKLVNVWERSVLDDPELEDAPRALYARDPGSATREQGIYNFLAEFVGWDLPEVLAFDGSRKPLYIETLLSLFFIEQTQGWTGIQSITPHFFQIKQVEKRAVEFILALDASRTDTQRQEIDLEEASLRDEWTELRGRLSGFAGALGGALRELPKEPQAAWPPTTSPYVEVYAENKPLPLREAIGTDNETLHRLETEEIPSADEAANQIREQLEEAFRQLYGAEMLLDDTRDELALERANLAALDTRLDATNEDLDHNRGERKVRDLGFADNLSVANQECPTCRQSMEDSLLDQREYQHVMTLDENIAYLEAQAQTIDKMRSRTTGSIDALTRRLTAVENYVTEVRARIRSLRRTLVSAGSAPSEAAVRWTETRTNRRAKALTFRTTFRQATISA